MKKWLIILITIFGIGFISSAILAGQVYYEDLQHYTDYEKKSLQAESLENIYIKSAIPVEIYPTSEIPYVEFNQSFINLVGSAPEYELSIETKGENTYIELNKIKEVYLSLGIKENRAQLSIYLPQTTINRLSISNNMYFSYKHNKQVVNLEGIHVNEVIADMNEAEFILDGDYQKININVLKGQMNLKSTNAVQLVTQGDIEQYLVGVFDKIYIKDNSKDITVDSNDTNSIDINSYYSNINLKGSYSSIKLDGNYNRIDIESESICKLYTDGYNNFINGNGAFNIMNLSEKGSQIEIQTTVIPTNFNFGGDTSNSIFNLTLPSNIPGLMIRYLSDNTEMNQLEYDEDSSFELLSDFSLEKVKGEKNEQMFIYGNSACQILINGNQENRLEIRDGVYNSRS